MGSRSRSRETSRPKLGPNVSLIGQADARRRLLTPALVLDLDAFEHNLDAMARLCRQAGKNLRPHAKTHKSSRIAALQAQRGAVGICAATLREARVMVDSGIKGVLITSPLAGEAKLNAFIDMLAIDPSVMVVVDSTAAALALESALERARRTATVLIDIDVGMRRTGVANAKSAFALARRLRGSDVLDLVGVQCYSGMVQHIETLRSRERTYRRQLVLLEQILDGFTKQGSPPRIVSGGGTGTLDIDRRAGLFTELQAGSYVFMDSQYNAVELFADSACPFRTSLFVQSVVLSKNHARTATIDAGLKSFAMDGPLPMPARGAPKSSTYQFYGDEFGLLTWKSPQARADLGKKIEFVTPHCDPTVNLHDFYHCVRGNRLVDIWRVDARGTL